MNTATATFDSNCPNMSEFSFNKFLSTAIYGKVSIGECHAMVELKSAKGALRHDHNCRHPASTIYEADLQSSMDLQLVLHLLCHQILALQVEKESKFQKQM